MSCRDRFRIINKPRQCGISTTAAVEAAWEFDNVPGAQIVIISKDKDAAVNFHKYIYNMLYSVRKNNPNAPRLIKENERETTNDRGARIMSLAASKETGRSFSATHLFFDEMAAAAYAEDIWQAASPTLAQTNGKTTVISTPKGRANLFYKIFETPGNMGFTTFSYAWWDVPTYNPYYKQYVAADSATAKKQWIEKAKQVKNGWYAQNRPKYSELQWRQEFEGAFDANAGSVFTERQIEKVFCANYLKQQDDPAGIFTEWWTEEKESKGIYSCGIDLGRKNDPTVIVTYDVSQRPARMVDFKYIEAGRAEWDIIQREIKKHVEFWGAEALHDGTGVGDSISDALMGYSEPFMFTKSAKQNIVELMQHAFDFRMLRIPKIPKLYQEHLRYVWDDKDIVQDTVMANGLAIHQFHETEDVFVGVADLNYVGAN